MFLLKELIRIISINLRFLQINVTKIITHHNIFALKAQLYTIFLTEKGNVFSLCYLEAIVSLFMSFKIFNSRQFFCRYKKLKKIFYYANRNVHPQSHLIRTDKSFDRQSGILISI